MDLALVGLLLPGVENLSLRALEGAATRAGYETALVPFAGFAGMDATLRRVLALRPRVCGVSIQSTESLLAALTFTRLLRERGYRGRIVCGGHVATLDAIEIVESEGGVDCVVRLAGEDALVRLLADPGPDELAAIPGLVWRDADGRARLGAPARAISPETALVPSERAISETLGIPCADLVASRGCEAHCGYCCVAEASDLARSEARRSGHEGARHERRGLVGLADEMAALHRERGVRVFSFMDDNLLPLEPALAARLADDLRAELDRRHVGPIAATLQLRADAVTDESARALLRLGLARAYVGIDAYTEDGLRSLGRASVAAAGGRALATLRAQGIPAIANALLLGPTTKLEALEREAAAIGAVRGGPIHLLPIEARSHTAITRRAERRGLVEGGFLHRTYRFEDERVARVGRALFELPSRLRQRSVPVAMYDLGEALGVAARLRPELELEELWSAWDRISAAWNLDQAETILRATAAARISDDAIEDLLRVERGRVSALDRGLLVDIDALTRSLEQRATRSPRPASARKRSVVMAAVASAMSLAGCSGAPVGADAGRADALSGLDAPGSPDAGIASDADVPAEDGPGDASPTDALACADPGRTPDPTPSSTMPGSHDCGFCEWTVEASVDAEGRVVSFAALGEDGGTSAPLPNDIRDCLAALFASHCYPSAAGSTVTFAPHCWIA